MHKWKEPTVVDSVVVVGTLTCYALLDSACDLKAAQMKGTYCIW